MLLSCLKSVLRSSRQSVRASCSIIVDMAICRCLCHELDELDKNIQAKNHTGSLLITISDWVSVISSTTTSIELHFPVSMVMVQRIWYGDGAMEVVRGRLRS